MKALHAKSFIPRPVIYRLSVYLRSLGRLRGNGVRTISSEDLASDAGVKPTQLRKDLAYFGQFGTRGLGYDVDHLSDIIGNVLGSEKFRPVILIGAGNLGMALLSYQGFKNEGFEIIAAFDADVDRQRNKRLVQPLLPIGTLCDYLRKNPVRMAILCIPAEAAQKTADLLFRHGISGILNFAPVIIQAPESVMVRNVNLAIELENLSYFIRDEIAPVGGSTGSNDE